MRRLSIANASSAERQAALIGRRRFLCSAGAFVSLLLAPAGLARAAEQVGAVQDVRGAAFAKAATGQRTLQRAAAVFIQEQVGTGPRSRLHMRLGKDTTLRLGEQALLTIERFLVDAGGEINLESGPLLLDRPGRKGRSSVQIRTPYGVIAVRGTRVFVGPSKNVYGVFVERGRVVVSAGGRRVVLRTGQGTDIRNIGSAPTPPARWKLERVRAALASVR